MTPFSLDEFFGLTRWEMWSLFYGHSTGGSAEWKRRRPLLRTCRKSTWIKHAEKFLAEKEGK